MSEDKLATFKINGGVWSQFMTKATGQDTNASALLKRFIDLYLDGDLDLEKPQPHGQIDLVFSIDECLDPIRKELAELRSIKIEATVPDRLSHVESALVGLQQEVQVILGKSQRLATR